MNISTDDFLASAEHIQRRMWLWVVLACGTTLFSGLGALYQEYRLAGLMARTTFEGDRSLMAARVANDALQCRRFEKEAFLNIGTEARFQGQIEEWRRSYDALQKHLDVLDRQYTAGVDRPAMDDWHHTVAAYRATFDEVVKEIERGEITSAESANMAMGPVKNAVRQLIDGTKAYSEWSADQVVATGVRLTTAIRVNAVITLLLILVPSLFIIIGAVSIGRQFADRNQRITQLNRELAASEALHRTMLSSVVNPLITIDQWGTIRSTSAAVETDFGWKPAELIGKNIGVLMNELHRSRHDDYLARRRNSMTRGIVLQPQVLTCVRKDGSTFSGEVTVWQVETDAETGPLFMGIIRDMTERERAQAEILHAKEMADAANKAKSQFLANMSHEIRTPMTAILGFADVLLENCTDAENAEAALIIKRNGEHLLRVINDILDLSKIEAERVEIEQIRFSPIQVVAEVLSLMRVRAGEKGLTLDVHYDWAIPATICSDSTRLRQILINLIGNAIKFTDNGGVRLAVSLVQTGHPEPLLQFDVIDDGIGMTEDQMSVLFLPFMQADASTTRRYGGTGLGLTICKRFATMLGGDITVSSVPGQGSTFTLTLPTGPLDGVPILTPAGEANDAPSEQQPTPQEDAHLDGRVLLAEDGSENRQLISFLLERAGTDVVAVENGQLAVDAALQALDGDAPFDVILMDMQMPVLDGYKATQRLRNAGYDLPIIALTAHAMADDRSRCIDAGCDDYATKPIDRKALMAMIRKYVQRRRARVSAI